MSPSAEGMQQQLEALNEFFSQRDLQVNLGKTKIMEFNTSRAAMRKQQDFIFKGEKVEVVSTYVYLGVTFTGPIFTMNPTAMACLAKGHASLSRLERFQAHFQDPGTKCLLFDTLVRPAAMYGAFWGPGLPNREWSRIERLQILMCSRMIRSKPSTPHSVILQAKFTATPLQIDAIFQIVTYLIRLEELASHRLPRLAMESSKHITLQGDDRTWYARIRRWLNSLGIQLDRLPPQYDLDAPFLCLTQSERNCLIRANILQLHTPET